MVAPLCRDHVWRGRSGLNILAITVGTSLFTSASWRPEGPFALIDGYRGWTTDLLKEPSARSSSGRRTRDGIEARLNQRATGDPGYFVSDLRAAQRYSAEVSTLLSWKEREGERELRDFINDRYGRTDLVCPFHPDDPARIAADHLLTVFRERLGLESVEIRDVITGRSLVDRVRQFQTYLQELPPKATVDLVVTGGYKVYAMFASGFAASPARRDRWRVIYQHEDHDRELVVQGAREGEVRLFVGNESLAIVEAEDMTRDR